MCSIFYRYGREVVEQFNTSYAGIGVMDLREWKHWGSTLSPQIRELIRYGLVLQGKVELWQRALQVPKEDYDTILKLPNSTIGK